MKTSWDMKGNATGPLPKSTVPEGTMSPLTTEDKRGRGPSGRRAPRILPESKEEDDDSETGLGGMSMLAVGCGGVEQATYLGPAPARPRLGGALPQVRRSLLWAPGAPRRRRPTG